MKFSLSEAPMCHHLKVINWRFGNATTQLRFDMTVAQYRLVQLNEW
jgi:hypothetical protein